MLREVEERNSKTGLSTAFLNHIAVLHYYAKSRSLIYIFPWATFISVLIASNGYPDPLTAGMAVGSGYLIMLAVYSYNDVVDLNVDRINAPNRPLVSGRVNRKELTRLIWILNGSGLALAAMINLQTLAVASALMLLGIVYSHPRTHYRDTFPLKTLLTATGAALVSLMGGLAVGNISPYVIYAALVFFTFESVLASLGDIHDVKGDKTVGRRTFPIVIGLRSTVAMMMMICASIALTAVMIGGIIDINNIGLMMVIAVCSIAIARLRGLFYNHDNRTYVKNTRHVMRFVHVFLQLALFVGMIL